MTTRYLVSVGQMCSTSDISANLAQAQHFIESAKKCDSSLIALPEMFHYLGESQEKKFETAQTLEGELVQQFQKYALKYSIAIAMGSFYEKIADDSTKLYNTAIFIDSNGEIVGVYRKIHLCDIRTENLQHLESKHIDSGNSVTVFDSSLGRIGSTICYDLRFPWLYQVLREKGSQVILVPAAFFLETGKDHWITLLKARAIETQSYVIAAAQYGIHYGTRCSFGNSLIVDPWGKVIACASEKECMITAEIDLNYLDTVRQGISVMEHKRNDLYSV